MIWYLDEVIIALVSVLPKMSVKTFKGEDKNNRLMSVSIDNEKLFGIRLRTWKILNQNQNKNQNKNMWW